MVTYDELSNLIGTCPDLAIFRRFGPLAAQVLLRMQAELLELDDDLKVLVGVEQQDSDLRGHAKSWGSVNDFVDAGGRSLRRETVLKAEEKLSRYYDFVSRTAAVLRLGSPDPCDVDFLRDWLENEKYGNNFLKESAAAEATAWDPDFSADLMALNRRSDRFAAFVANNLLPSYHRGLGHRFHRKAENGPLGLFYIYHDHKFGILANILCTTLSAVIPSSSILVLYYVQSMLARLLLILGFSSLFSFIMGVITQGKRYEIFAATTAFAAVLVVFVGGVTVVPGG